MLNNLRTPLHRFDLYRACVATAITCACLAIVTIMQVAALRDASHKLKQISSEIGEGTRKILDTRQLAMSVGSPAQQQAAGSPAGQEARSGVEAVQKFRNSLELLLPLSDNLKRRSSWSLAEHVHLDQLATHSRATVAAGKILADAAVNKNQPAQSPATGAAVDLPALKLQFLARSESLLAPLNKLERQVLAAAASSVTTTSHLAVSSILLAMIAAVAGWLTARKHQQLMRRVRGALRTAHRIANTERSHSTALSEGVNALNGELLEKIERLNEANDEILRRGKLAQLGQLTATVAHEIRNPLGAIRTAAYLIDRKTKDLELGIESPMKRIATGVARCDKIISELLDFTRSNTPDLKAHSVDAWLKTAIEEDLKELPSIISITYDFGLGDTVALYDEDRMRRVLINLLSNASEAMVGKSDGLGIAGGRPPEIAVKTEMVNNVIEISVTDNGPGISEENMKKIMEPLFTTKSFGVGLGLPAVQKILQQHGGGLRVASTPGSGAVFTAWFPAVRPNREAA